MANYDTKISFGVDVKGAQSAQKALDDLSKTAIDNAKKQRDQATVTADALAKVAEDARRAAEEVANSGKREDAEHKKRVRVAKEAAREKARAATDAGRVQEAAIKKVQRLEEHDHVQRLRRAAAVERDTEKARDKQNAAAQRARTAQPITAAPRGAFGQGFLQGAMPGNITRFIDRGPGAVRQAAGIMAGSTLSSLASIPFTGVGGVMGAAGALGSLISAPLDRMFGNAGSALERQRGQLGMMPFLGRYGVQQMAGTGGLAGLSDQALHARALQMAGQASTTSLPVREQTALLRRIKQQSDAAVADVPAGAQRDAYLRAAGADRNGLLPDVQRRETARVMAGMTESRLLAERARDRNASQGYNPLTAMGRRFGGLSLAQTQQFAVSQAMRAGGQVDDLAQQGLVETGLAANVQYGIGANVSGAFGRAGRLGGIVGGPGEGSDRGLARVIGNAVALGLTGSDLTRYMEQTANILGNFETTGIPLAAGAIGSAAAGFSRMGMAAPLAQSAAMGMTSTLQSVGDTGPQDAFGVAVMQALGGAQSYGGQLQAMEELRSPTAETSRKVWRSLAPRVRNRGQGAIGRADTRALLKRLNMPAGPESINAVAQSLGRGDYDLPHALQGGLTPEALQAGAAGLTPGALRTQAAMADTQVGLGEKAVGTTQAAEGTANAFAKSVSDVLGPVLNGLAEALNGLTGYLASDAYGKNAARAAAADGTAEAP